MIKQNEIDKNNEKFDEEIKNLEDKAQAEKDKIDEEYTEEKIYQIAQQALKDGYFKDLDGNIVKVKDAFIEFENKFGDGLSVMGNLIKDELINNLETTTLLMKDLGKIMDSLNLKDFGKVDTGIFGNGRSTVSEPKARAIEAPNLEFNSPLIHIEGNVDEGVMQDLENVANRIKDSIYGEIAQSLRLNN